MIEYHKINTLFKRDELGRIIPRDWSCPEFDYLKNCEWVGTEKIDGTNIRVIWRRGQCVEIRGKTDAAQLYAPLIFMLGNSLDHYQIDAAVSEVDELTLYGEGCGARIQKGGSNYIKDGVGFILFDVRIGDLWLRREDVVSMAKRLAIPCVPEIYRGGLLRAVEAVKAGFNSAWGPFAAEGMVLKPAVELQTRRGHRIVTKIKHRDFA